MRAILKASLMASAITLGATMPGIAIAQNFSGSSQFSSAGVKLIKASKKLEVTIAMKGSGGGTGKATFKEFTVTK